MGNSFDVSTFSGYMSVLGQNIVFSTKIVKWGGFIMDAPVITASSSFSDAPVITVSPARSSQGLEGFGTV